MLAAGHPGAKKRAMRPRPDRAKPWVKTSAWPRQPRGHRLPRGHAGLTMEPLDRSSASRPGRLRLHHLHRQLRATCPSRSRRRHHRAATWSCASVLSGNRNFEGRILAQDIKANYLASSAARRCVRAGRHGRHRPHHRTARNRFAMVEPVYLRDIWPSDSGGRRRHLVATFGAPPSMYQSNAMRQRVHRQRHLERDRGRRSSVGTGDLYSLGSKTRHTCAIAVILRRAHACEDPVADRSRFQGCTGAGRCSAKSDHHRSHLAGRCDQDRQSGQRVAICVEHGVQPHDFNSYGSPGAAITR